MKNKLSQIKMGAVISYIALALNTATGLIYTPWMVDKIGQENYGLYSLATSLIAIFMLDFGLGSAVSRFISKYRAEGNQQAANDIIGLIYKLYISIDAVIFVVLVGVFFFLGSIYKSLTADEIETFKTLYIMVAAFNIISFPFSPLNGILNAYEKFIQLKLCDLFNRIFTLCFVVAALFFTKSVVVVVLANIVSNLLTILIKWIIVKSQVPIRVNFKAQGRTMYKNLFGFTIWTTINSIMQRFTHSFAPSILGMNASSVEIAIYTPAVTLEGYYYTLSTAVNGLFLPRVSKYIADKEENKILELLIKVGRYQVILLGLVFIGFFCVGKEFMVLWMGPEFEKTYICALIILFPTLIGGTQQIANTTVIAKNLVKYQAYCMMVTGVVGLVVSFIVSMYIGSIGVCIGTAVTTLLNTLYMNVIYYKKADINMPEFYKKCYLRALPSFLVTAILGILINKAILINGWIGLLVKAVAISVMFVVLIWSTYFTKNEQKSIVDKIRKKFK